MPRVKVTVPGVCKQGETLGLALAVHHTVEMSLRTDTQRAANVPNDHPVLRGVAAYFEHQKRDPIGYEVLCTGDVPADLGSDAVWTVAGMAAINSLLGAPLRREGIAPLAYKVAGTAAITAQQGGLTATTIIDGEPVFRRLDVSAMRVVIAVPENLPRKSQPISQPTLDPGRALLIAESLRKGDIPLLRQILTPEPYPIPVYDIATKHAPKGDSAVMLCGSTVIVFAATNHEAVSRALAESFRLHKVSARTLIAAVDTQGVAISMMR
jgi:homoserine kinase